MKQKLNNMRHKFTPSGTLLTGGDDEEIKLLVVAATSSSFQQLE
jgi:hypothetical protein